MIIFIDTSALVKLYHREDGTNQLRTFLGGTSGDDVVAMSDLALVELQSALLRKVRMKEITLAIANDVYDSFLLDLEKYFVVSIDRNKLLYAIGILQSFGNTNPLRALDAIQLACALKSHPVEKVRMFISADNTLLTLARHFFSTYNPEESV